MRAKKGSFTCYRLSPAYSLLTSACIVFQHLESHCTFNYKSINMYIKVRGHLNRTESILRYCEEILKLNYKIKKKNSKTCTPLNGFLSSKLGQCLKKWGLPVVLKAHPKTEIAKIIRLDYETL